MPPLLAIALLAIGGFAAAEGGVDAETAPDPAALIAEARRVQVRDLEVWRRFAFRRQVVRQRLDDRGEVALRQDLVFRVEPAVDGFDETLVAIDGRAPSAREIREHRHEARFTRHYDHAREGKLGGVLGFGELDFGYIFRGLHYRYAGRETTAGGIACHRLAIEPLTGDAAVGAADPLAAATAGDLWLAVDGLHVVRASTRLTRPVRQGLARAERLDLDFEAQRVEGAWLPRRIELRSALGGLLRLHAHNIYTYSQFEDRRARGVGPHPAAPIHPWRTPPAAAPAGGEDLGGGDAEPAGVPLILVGGRGRGGSPTEQKGVRIVPSGDRSRTWFPEMVEQVRQTWRRDLGIDEVIALARSLDRSLQSIRTERGIRPPMIRCPRCGTYGPAAARRVSVRATILAAGRFGITTRAEVKRLERSWRDHRSRRGLDLSGDPVVPPDQAAADGCTGPATHRGKP